MLDPYDPLTMQRWPLTESVSIQAGEDRLDAEMNLAHTEASKARGDWSFVADAAEIAQARRYLGLPQHQNDCALFDEYESLCLADRVNPDTVAWFAGQRAPLPATFSEYLVALFRWQVYRLPWADYPTNLAVPRRKRSKRGRPRKTKLSQHEREQVKSYLYAIHHGYTQEVAAGTQGHHVETMEAWVKLFEI